MIYDCFARTSLGLESLLELELVNLGVGDVKQTRSGCQFRANVPQIMQINLWSRYASRVMIQLGFSGYRHEDDIYKLARKITWEEWFNVGHSFKVITDAHRSSLKSLDFITLRVKDAICDRFVAKYSERPNVDKTNPDMRIYSFLTKDTVAIYLDTSGEGLFKRGYRRDKLSAPLKENLAAGLIGLSGWDYTTMPLFDPMCGSGTIVIEALHMALNIPPGGNRNFAFNQFVGWSDKEWAKIKSCGLEQIRQVDGLTIYAGDISQEALKATEQNLASTGFAQYVKLKSGDFLQQSAPSAKGMVVTNLPYGVRQSDQEAMAAIYPLLGDHLKHAYPNWTAYLFSADLRLPKLIGLKPSRKLPVYNGGLECRLYEFKIR